MKKKLLSIILLIIVVVSFVLYHYCIYYPANPNLISIVLFEVEWLFLLIICSSIFVVSFLADYVLRKYKKSFPVLLILLSLFLVFIVVNTCKAYIESKKTYEELLEMYIIKARKDIENDRIEIEYFGTFAGIKDGCYSQLDSVAGSFGVQLMLTKSTVDPIGDKAEERYFEITNSYLDTRNGEGWKERMDKELEPYLTNQK